MASSSFWTFHFQRTYSLLRVAPWAAQQGAAVFQTSIFRLPTNKKNLFLCSLNLSWLPFSSLLWSVSGTLLPQPLLLLPLSPFHRLIRPMELSHLQDCENKLLKCLSATPVVVRPDEVSGWPAGGSQLSPNINRQLCSKDAHPMLSTSHQKQHSSSFLWTYESPLWESPTKFSKFVFRMSLKASYKNWQCLTNNLGEKKIEIFSLISAQQNAKLGFLRRAYEDILLPLKLVPCFKCIY